MPCKYPIASGLDEYVYNTINFIIVQSIQVFVREPHMDSQLRLAGEAILFA
jgi:hypothetical protein